MDDRPNNLVELELPPELCDPRNRARRARPLFSFATDRAIRDMASDDIARFFSYVEPDPESDCLVWQRYKTPAGYGVMSVHNISVRVHRIAYWHLVAPLDHRVEVDHLCRNRACVNPDHLEAVTHAENVRRGQAGSNWAAKAECPRGHPYAGANLRIARTGARVCRACNAERMRHHRAAQKGIGDQQAA